MRTTFLGVILIFLSACGRDSGPSLRVLNQRCAVGKIAGEYLLKTKSGVIKIMYASSSQDLLDQAASLGMEVDSIDYNFKHSLDTSDHFSISSNNTGIGQYGQEMIGAPTLWNQGIFGEGVKIAVIDTGLDVSNSFFQEQVFVNKFELGNDEDSNGFVNDVNGWDFVNDQPLTNDLQGHGTEVTSIIAAEHLTDLKIGVAPKSTILPIAALMPNEDGTDASASSDLLVKAVDYARKMNVDIINASWGGNGCSSFLRNSVEKATNNQILFITSSGNDGENIDVDLEFPSSFNIPFVISVGGVNASGQIVGSSNFGSRVNFFAPGEGILSVKKGDGFNLALVTGTSIAAPFISGALALLKSAVPSATNESVLNALSLSNNNDRLPSLVEALDQLLLDKKPL